MPVAEHSAPEKILAALKGLPAGEPMALAVSGGADSTALMLAASRRADVGSFHVLSVDHGLRAAAAAEATQVRSWAKALGLNHHVLTWREVKPETGLQAAAREARYGLMTDWCRANGVSTLITAHTLDDQAETVLMRLKRGSGVDGLAGMAKQSWRSGIRLMRPLLEITHEELVGSLEAADHPWIEDPSNQDERYERIQIRNRSKELAALGLTRSKLVATARKMTRAREALDQSTSDLLAACADVSEYGFCRLLADGLGRAPDELAIRALARCIQAIGGSDWPPGDEPLERLLSWLRSGAPDATTLGGCRLVKRGASVLVGRELGRISDRQVALPDGQILWDGRFRIRAERPISGLNVGPLEGRGWAHLKAQRPDLPAFVGQTLPAIRRGEELLAVPSLAFVAPGLAENVRFSAKFANLKLICS
ncbi:MAG: tRNA lysidine(34) synthetase TilS [Pseudomonadota bacterium]